MTKQHSLFGSLLADHSFDHNVRSNSYRLEEVDIGDITFLSSRNESVHRWYRLTPSFSPSLVRYFINKWRISSNSLVHDPFSGRGTTAIECQKNAIPCIAFEINPILQLVGKHSLDWRPETVDGVLDYLVDLKKSLAKFRKTSLEGVATATGEAIPDIHDVFRWWKPEVLHDLLIAKSLFKDNIYSSIKNYLWVILTEASIETANIHRNHPTITFDDNHERIIDVFSVIERKALDVIADIHSLKDSEIKCSGIADVRLEDSCRPRKPLLPQSITHVVTSPPYPNRYSYVHQTRPQLHFMDAIPTRRCATDIDLKAVGGTWGAATSALMKELIVPPASLSDALDYWDVLSKKNILMCNYATKYFIDMEEHLRNLKPALVSGAMCAYVVGNSRLSGVEIYTETILARIFEMLGYSIDAILLFRKRGGRKRLYETAVIARA